jgi:hypothetical protein
VRLDDRHFRSLGSLGQRQVSRLERFGVAGFLFFLVKGLLWLSLPVVAYLSRD